MNAKQDQFKTFAYNTLNSEQQKLLLHPTRDQISTLCQVYISVKK